MLEVAAACRQSNSQERLKPVLEAFGIDGIPAASSNLNFERIPMTIETKFDSNYRKVLVAARRARQIQSGSQALVPTHSTKACRIAQDEVEAGKIAYVKKRHPGRQAAGGETGIPILSAEAGLIRAVTVRSICGSRYRAAHER